MWQWQIRVFRTLNTLRPRQNCHHFADDIFECIFLNENVRISLKISLNFVPTVQINNIPALVLIMAWRRPGDKPLSEPMMVCLLKQICVTRPQWVKPRMHFSIGIYESAICKGRPGAQNILILAVMLLTEPFYLLLGCSWHMSKAYTRISRSKPIQAKHITSTRTYDMHACFLTLKWKCYNFDKSFVTTSDETFNNSIH